MKHSVSPRTTFVLSVVRFIAIYLKSLNSSFVVGQRDRTKLPSFTIYQTSSNVPILDLYFDHFSLCKCDFWSRLQTATLCYAKLQIFSGPRTTNRTTSSILSIITDFQRGADGSN